MQIQLPAESDKSKDRLNEENGHEMKSKEGWKCKVKDHILPSETK